MAKRSSELTSRSSRFIMLASICLVVTVLYFAYDVLMPLVLAMLLAFLLLPVVSRLERWHLGRTPSVLIVVLAALGVVGWFGFVVGQQFKDVMTELPQYGQLIRKKVSNVTSGGGFFQKAAHDVDALSKDVAGGGPTSQPATPGGPRNPAANPLLGTFAPKSDHPETSPSEPTPDKPLPVRVYPATSPFEIASNWAGRVIGPLTTAGLVLVFVIFMLLVREDLRDRIIRLIGHGRLNVTTQAIDEAGSRISRYLLMQAAVNAIYGLCTLGGLWLIGKLFSAPGENGFPNVLLAGLIVGLLRFVPYIGIFIGAALPLILSIALFQHNSVFFATLGMFAVYEIIVSQFVEPYLYGASTGMSALAVLVAAVFWTWLWGPIGLLLSTPLTVCLVVMGKYVPALHFLDILLGDEPVLEPHVRIYQRLLALDAEEAADVVRETRKQRPLEEVYDALLVPALLMAERDRTKDEIDEQQHSFILHTVRDLVTEMGEEQQAADAKEDAKAEEADAKALAAPHGSEIVPVKRRLSLPKDCTIKVLCLPSHDEADSVVAAMLAQLLTLRGYCAEAVGSDALVGEMVQLVESKKADIVCVSALPPAAVAHARYLFKRLRARYAELKMIVGIWTVRDTAAAGDRISPQLGAGLVASLAQAEAQIEQMVHPTLLAATASQTVSS